MRIIGLMSLLTVFQLLVGCSGGKEALKRNSMASSNLIKVWENGDFNCWLNSLLVHNNKLYFGNNEEHQFYALDFNTGSLKWKYPTEEACYFKPAFTDGRVHFTSFDQHLYTLDTTGKLLWKVELSRVVKSDMVSMGGIVIISVTGDGVFAFEASSGKEIWKVPQQELEVTTSKMVGLGNTIYVGNVQNSFMAIDAKSGKVIWQWQSEHSLISAAAVTRDKVFVGVNNVLDENQSLVLALDRVTGKEIWKLHRAPDSEQIPLFYNDKLYIGTMDSKLVCLNPENGSVLWEYFGDNGILCDGEIVGQGGNVYFSNYNSDFYAVNAETGKLMFKVDDPVLLPPVLYNNSVYVGGRGVLFRVK